MVRTDDETPWTRHLVIAVGAVAVVALVIGGVVSMAALGAARVAGFDEARPTAAARPSLYLPTGVPTTTVEGYPDPEGAGGGSAAQPSGGGSGDRTRRPPRRPAPALTVRAAPSRVAPGERITLTGRYRGHDGDSLQVQRFSGAWADFPVQARVRGGTYSTYIITSRTGVNRLRMLDPRTGTTSRPVRVRVG